MSGYRNGFEARCGAMLGQAYSYDSLKLGYTTAHTYMPDFIDLASRTIV